MDELDRLAGPATDLLTRVDDVLAAAGAPADHPIWPLLRRVGALPGDVLEAFHDLTPELLSATASAVRVRAEACTGERADLSAAVAATPWTGDAADAFTARWNSLGEHLGGAADPLAPTLAGRFAATASYVDEVASWMRGARRDLAHELARVLGSMEAVQLKTSVGVGAVGAAGAGAAGAAAAIGVRVLAVADRQAEVAEDVASHWGGRLDELRFQPAMDTPGRTGRTANVPL